MRGGMGLLQIYNCFQVRLRLAKDLANRTKHEMLHCYAHPYLVCKGVYSI